METQNEYQAELMDDLRKENQIVPETTEEEMMELMEQDRREEINEKFADLMEQGIF